MPKLQESTQLPFSKEQLFDLVLDIESYPEFLPWCKAARILPRDGDDIYADLVLNFKGFTEKYTSKITYNKPHSISVEMVEGPFEYLVNNWNFNIISENCTEIDFFIDFRFKSRIFELMIGAMFEKAQKKMAGAFLERANKIYGG